MKSIAEIVRHPSPTGSTLKVVADVSMDELHFEAAIKGELVKKEVANRTLEIGLMLTMLLAKAKLAGYSQVCIVVEPTGCYHELLLRIAENRGMETSLVNTSAVKHMRQVLFGDSGKTDVRDPTAIRELAERGHVLTHRRLPEVFQVMRRYNVIIDTAEREIVNAKCRIHRCLKALFPDLDFCAGFQYTNSGRAIMAAYGFDPHAIVRAGLKRVTKKLKRLVPRIRNCTLVRLVDYAEASVQATPDGRMNQARALELQLAWNDLEFHEKRRADTRSVLENLYDEARQSDPNLPKPAKGFASKINLARLIAETGPPSDFNAWRQLMKMAGLNLCERQSGKYQGITKISKTGRRLLRKILTQMALPLVKKRALFGQYYHHKRNVEKKKGGVAITAVARKLLKLIWGVYKAGGEFSADRVFVCESQFAQAA